VSHLTAACRDPYLTLRRSRPPVCTALAPPRLLALQDWTGSSGFNAAPVSNWTANGAAAGEVRNYGNFTFLRVFNAGHMVPADPPAAALAMLDTMIHGGGW
jgi:carboxypeptidase C (cathepsin A)